MSIITVKQYIYLTCISEICGNYAVPFPNWKKESSVLILGYIYQYVNNEGASKKLNFNKPIDPYHL